MRIGQPPRVITACESPLVRQLQIHTGAGVANILPSYLIGQTVFVVSRRIQLVEGPAGAVFGIAVAGSVVVFHREPRLESSVDQGLSQDPVPGPCADGVGAL